MKSGNKIPVQCLVDDQCSLERVCNNHRLSPFSPNSCPWKVGGGQWTGAWGFTGWVLHWCEMKMWEEASAWRNSMTVISSVQFSCSVVFDSLQPHELKHARPPCPSPTPGVHPNPCPLCWWCHPTISSSIIPFPSCPQSLPASGSFQVSQFFVSGEQSTGVSASASVLPMNIQDGFPLGLTGWISLQSKGLSRVFSNTTIQKHQFFGAHLSLI